MTLSGGGRLNLSNNSQNFILGAARADTLTNQSTIQGSGNIGDNQMTLVNSGTINANVSNPLIIQPSGGTTNTGTMEASSGGTLVLDNSITNKGGVIKALAGIGSNAGGTVVLNGATIVHGTLTTFGLGAPRRAQT